MEIFKKYKCIEYGIQYDKDNNAKLFLVEDGCGYTMDDTAENRKHMEKEFDTWKNSITDAVCDTCSYKDECEYFNK